MNTLSEADIAVAALACETFDEDAAAKLGAQLVQDGTWQVPTLFRSRTTKTATDPDLASDPDLRYVSAKTLKGWKKATKKFAGFSPQSQDTLRLLNDTMYRLTRIFDEAGVGMLAGSDATGAGWEIPGAALHHEIDELAAAGLTPLRVLQMTTSDAATYLGAEADMGSVEVGKRADLVLLDANPIESVAHLHRVSGVLQGTRSWDAAQLSAIKDDVADRRAI